MFRWVAPEPRCALVIKNVLRAATLAGYSNFYTSLFHISRFDGTKPCFVQSENPCN